MLKKTVVPGYSLATQNQELRSETTYGQNLENIADASLACTEHVNSAVQTIGTTKEVDLNPGYIASNFLLMKRSEKDVSKAANRLNKADARVQKAEEDLDKAVEEARGFGERMRDMWEEHPVKTVMMCLFVVPMLLSIISNFIGSLIDDMKVGIKRDTLSRKISQQQKAQNDFVKKRDQFLEKYLVSKFGPEKGKAMYSEIQNDMKNNLKKREQEKENKSVDDMLKSCKLENVLSPTTLINIKALENKGVEQEKKPEKIDVTPKSVNEGAINQKTRDAVRGQVSPSHAPLEPISAADIRKENLQPLSMEQKFQQMIDQSIKKSTEPLLNEVQELKRQLAGKEAELQKLSNNSRGAEDEKENKESVTSKNSAPLEYTPGSEDHAKNGTNGQQSDTIFKTSSGHRLTSEQYKIYTLGKEDFKKNQGNEELTRNNLSSSETEIYRFGFNSPSARREFERAATVLANSSNEAAHNSNNVSNNNQHEKSQTTKFKGNALG